MGVAGERARVREFYRAVGDSDSRFGAGGAVKRTGPDWRGGEKRRCKAGGEGTRAHSARFAGQPRTDWRAERGGDAVGVEADNAAIEDEAFWNQSAEKTAGGLVHPRSTAALRLFI